MPKAELTERILHVAAFEGLQVVYMEFKHVA